MKCRFIGRDYELETLQGLVEKQAASLVVITGRRRIGKSRRVYLRIGAAARDYVGASEEGFCGADAARIWYASRSAR